MRSLLAALAFFPLLAPAQIVIGPGDMPAAGDTVRLWTTQAVGIDPAPTEAGYIWDFSMLSPDMEVADTCVTVASTPLLYQFYFNNGFLYPEHQANYAVRGQDFSFQVLTVSDVYEYFKKDAQGFRNVGFGANVNGVPTSTRRLPPDWIHRFPLEYGDMDTSYSEFTLTVPTLFSFTQQQTRYNEVDGWGTLYLPADTFEVLRVKSTLDRVDSAYIEQFGQGLTFPEPQAIEYKWIAAGMDLPVLQINMTGGQATTARFHYSPDDITTGVGETRARQLRVWPNPAEGLAWISLPIGSWKELIILDAGGRQVLSTRIGGSGARTIALQTLESGVYSIIAQGEAGRQSARLVVQ